MTTPIWVHKRTEPSLWTVGWSAPDGTWHPESDHDSSAAAAERVHYLNGGTTPAEPIEGPDWQAVARDNKQQADYWRDAAMRCVATHYRPPTYEQVREHMTTVWAYATEEEERCVTDAVMQLLAERA